MALKPIPGREFERYLVAKGAETGCMACGHSSLTVHDEQMAGSHFALMAFKFPDFAFSQGVNFSSLLVCGCTHCGTLRFTDRTAVVDWLTKHPH